MAASRDTSVPVTSSDAENISVYAAKDSATGRVMLMPGHTPGHIIVVFDATTPPRAIVGDVIFQGSIGRTDLPGGNHDVMMQTLRRFLPMPDDTILYPGHGPETTIGAEKKWNPFLAPIAAGE